MDSWYQYFSEITNVRGSHRNFLLKTIILLRFRSTPDELFTWDHVSVLIKQPELFYYSKYWLQFIVCYLRQRHGSLTAETAFLGLSEETFWLKVLPPTSLRRNQINESRAWTLTWLLRHEQEATLPPSVAIMLSSHWLMHTGLLAGVVWTKKTHKFISTVFVIQKASENVAQTTGERLPGIASN